MKHWIQDSSYFGVSLGSGKHSTMDQTIKTSGILSLVQTLPRKELFIKEQRFQLLWC